MASPLQDMKKLTSMKVTPKPKKDYPVEAGEMDKPEYPYGLRISLNQDSLSKLKLGVKDFKIGDKVMIMAECEVCEVRSSSSEYSESENVEMKITSMTAAPKSTRRNQR